MVYDCFTFFNELDLLELRLNILDGVVDKFVLVEATQNHQGKEKPLYFNENKERFSKFSSKIIHVIVDKYPSNPDNNSWVLEHHQRNSIAQGLKDCKPDDVVLISDVDEIPDPEKIKEHKDDRGIKIFRQRMFYYFMNCVNVTDVESGRKKYNWNGTVMIHFSDAGENLQRFRELSLTLLGVNHPKFIHRTYWKLWMWKNVTMKGMKVRFIANGGWHFSYLGGVERIIKKLESFAHTEYNKEEFKDPKKIEEAIANGKDILGRDFHYKFIPVDDTFPKYLLMNREKYAHLIKS